MAGDEQALEELLAAVDRHQAGGADSHSATSDSPYRGAEVWPFMARPSADRNAPAAQASATTIQGATECRYECPWRWSSTPALLPNASQ